MKDAISVTLTRENLLWLRGQARAAGARSVSEMLDRILEDARQSGRAEEAAIRSVKGTIRIAADDPELGRADAAVRKLFPRPEPRRRNGGRERSGGSPSSRGARRGC